MSQRDSPGNVRLIVGKLISLPVVIDGANPNTGRRFKTVGVLPETFRTVSASSESCSGMLN